MESWGRGMWGWWILFEGDCLLSLLGNWGIGCRGEGGKPSGRQEAFKTRAKGEVRREAIKVEKMDKGSMEFDQVRAEVMEATLRRLKSLNEGGESASRVYLPDATVDSPQGRFRGRDKIQEFWGPLVLGPSVTDKKAVVERNTTVEPVSEDSAMVSQCFSLPKGGDVMTRGRWVRQSGEWFLADDEVVQIDQYGE